MGGKAKKRIIICDRPTVTVMYKGSVASDYAQAIMGQPQSPSLEKCITVEMLDHDRQQKQFLQLQEDVHAVAQWIRQATGHPISQTFSTTPETTPEELQLALESGEALSDLINAIWPGRIVGILRGELNHFQRINNVDHFLQTCKVLGVEEVRLFVTSDLVEGKNFRAVILCLLALAELVPLPPHYNGPRLNGPRCLKRSSTQHIRQDICAPFSPPDTP